jgi:hypothetical protein
MLKADQIKVNLLQLLEKDEMTLGQLKRKLKIPHHYTLTNALEFLKQIDLIEIIDMNDKLGTKKVKLKNRK